MNFFNKRVNQMHSTASANLKIQYFFLIKDEIFILFLTLKFGVLMKTENK